MSQGGSWPEFTADTWAVVQSQVGGGNSSDKTQVPFGLLTMPQSSWSYNLHPNPNHEQHWLPRQSQGLWEGRAGAGFPNPSDPSVQSHCTTSHPPPPHNITPQCLIKLSSLYHINKRNPFMQSKETPYFRNTT